MVGESNGRVIINYSETFYSKSLWKGYRHVDSDSSMHREISHSYLRFKMYFTTRTSLLKGTNTQHSGHMDHPFSK